MARCLWAAASTGGASEPRGGITQRGVGYLGPGAESSAAHALCWGACIKKTGCGGSVDTADLGSRWPAWHSLPALQHWSTTKPMHWNANGPPETGVEGVGVAGVGGGGGRVGVGATGGATVHCARDSKTAAYVSVAAAACGHGGVKQQAAATSELSMLRFTYYAAHIHSPLPPQQHWHHSRWP